LARSDRAVCVAHHTKRNFVEYLGVQVMRESTLSDVAADVASEVLSVALRSGFDCATHIASGRTVALATSS
jgi:hypothetical protein